MSKAGDLLEAIKNGIEGSTKAMAQRLVNAERNFYDYAMNQHGFTKEEAIKILEVYLKVKAIKLDAVGGDFKVKHGAYLDKDTMERALENYDFIMKKNKK